MFFAGHGKHAPGGRGWHRLAILASVVAGLMVVLAGVAVAGQRYERGRAGRILPGVRIGGVDVGGMTTPQARAALQPLSREILDRTVTVQGTNTNWTRTAASLGVSVDVEGAIRESLSLSSSYPWTARLYHRLLNKPVQRTVALPVGSRKAVVDRFMNGLVPSLRVEPHDASVAFVRGRLVLRHASAGAELMAGRAATLLFGAVRNGLPSIKLPMRTVPAAVADDDIGLTIVVRLSQNRLLLYGGTRLAKQYPVATGQRGKYPTPMGTFRIITKEVDPTWHNPARTTWGKDEPAEIGPGPGNPLGTRAMALTSPGILIHGTYDDASIGHWASHGCIRMHIPDSVDLFERVQIGTRVIVVW
jgi:lipoprotein-anchoring transpeptidase ErfK/SrfK